MYNLKELKKLSSRRPKSQFPTRTNIVAQVYFIKAIAAPLTSWNFTHGRIAYFTRHRGVRREVRNLAVSFRRFFRTTYELLPQGSP
jgi:hypothetical protein